MLDPVLYQELCAIVGAENVAIEKQDLICYGYDATQMEFLPKAVVHPANTEEVSALLKLANLRRFPVFPRVPAAALPAAHSPRQGGGAGDHPHEQDFAD